MAIFLGLYRPEGGAEEAWQQLQTQFDIFADAWRKSPNVFRVDGAPVIAIYSSFDYTVEEWRMIMERFEARYGKAIWLINFWWKTYDVSSKPTQLREYLPWFDGVTAYANWSSQHQQELYETIGPIMHEEFPQKIFEGTVHNTYAVHYHHGGIAIRLSEKYRESWKSMHDCRPDSIMMTNLFDHWENSLVLPCYEREDFILRYAEYQMSRLFGKKFHTATEPELVLTNYIDLIPFTRPVCFEVVAFPLEGDSEIAIGLEIANADGTIVHSFPPLPMKLNQLHTLVFRMPDNFPSMSERALIPRLVMVRNGEIHHGNWNPPTVIDTSIRTSWMFWARSTRNALPLADGNDTWKLNGQKNGTIDWRQTNGFGVFTSNVVSSDENVTLRRIMRNGMQWRSEAAKNMHINRAYMLPYPGGALNFYWLEMENAAGNRFQGFPVWVDSGLRPGTVEIPVKTADGNISGHVVEKARIPYFEYPCDVDTGSLLVDISGYEHHGRLQQGGGVSYAFGSLGSTGYYHRHEGETENTPNPHYRQDASGRGYLHFDKADKDFYMISGGTAFPYASTYEVEFRISEFSEETMFLLGSANGQINLSLNAQGYVCASRGGAVEGAAGTAPQTKTSVTVVSEKPVEFNRWYRVAVVYDLKHLSLYLDNVLQGEKAIMPTTDHETIDHLTVGSACGFLTVPQHYFSGDLRRLRFYGRNLAPEELQNYADEK